MYVHLSLHGISGQRGRSLILSVRRLTDFFRPLSLPAVSGTLADKRVGHGGAVATAGDIQGLYLVSDDPPRRAGDDWLRMLDLLLAAGVDVLQLRDKQAAGSGRGDGLAGDVLSLCRRHRVPLIINDDVDLAARIGADGVHLGRDDLSLAEARQRLGAQALIGISCYGSLARARQAAGDGADYVAFGSCFPSSSKPDAAIVPLPVLQAARSALTIPIVAIGGITAARLPPLLAAGIDAVAVISEVFAATDPVSAVRRLQQQWRAAAGDIGC